VLADLIDEGENGERAVNRGVHWMRKRERALADAAKRIAAVDSEILCSEAEEKLSEILRKTERDGCPDGWRWRREDA